MPSIKQPINFYEETIERMKNYNKDWENVKQISINDLNIPIDTFKVESKKINYQNDFGELTINPYLIILFKDNSWLKRVIHNYSEYWFYVEIPTEAKTPLSSISYNPLFNSNSSEKETERINLWWEKKQKEFSEKNSLPKNPKNS